MKKASARKDKRSKQPTRVNNFREALNSFPVERRESVFRKTLKSLPKRHREAMILTEASSFSLAEGAQIAGCDIKIFKNRVRSGRRQLAKILSAEVAGALGVNINDAGIDIIGPTLDDKANPPKLAEFLLIMLAPRRRAEHMIGDMDEHFTRECKEFGRDRAVRRYWARTFWSLWPLLWRAIGRAVKGGVVIAAARRLTGL